MPDRPGPPTLSLALTSVLGASMDARTRTVLLTVVRPSDADAGDAGGGDVVTGGTRVPREVVPFPLPRVPLDDGPDAA